MAYQPTETTYTIGTIAQTMVGMWMAGYVGAIDLTTDAKNKNLLLLQHFADLDLYYSAF